MSDENIPHDWTKLKEELKKVNLRLPASIYIPFVNSKTYLIPLIIFILGSIRNYAILHIVTGEAKVFQTKERAPLLLCFEAYRPEELVLMNPERAI